MSADKLKRKLKSLQPSIPEAHAVRMHRAISWLKAAENQINDPDLAMISLWICWNSCYAADRDLQNDLSEKKQFKEFAEKLLALDKEERLSKLFWAKYSGALRVFINNHFVYEPFWENLRGNHNDWERSFQQSVSIAEKFLGTKNIPGFLQILMDRLYTLRNQLVHGGATYKSRINRQPLKDACNILSFLLPIIIDLMLDHSNEDWGKIHYPPVNA